MSTNPDKSLLYLYDLPKQEVTSVQLSNTIKELTGYELAEAPQIRRTADKPFYTAIIKINDPEKFKEVSQKMKYFELNGKTCRALPYDRELMGVNRANTVKSNVFLKGISKDLTADKVEQQIKEKLGADVKSTKVSINPDHSSRGYGFALFTKPEDAQRAVSAQGLPFEVMPYNPKDKKDLQKSFNNIYIKNFPNSWDEAKLREIFGKYGNISSVAVMNNKVQKDGQEQESKFAFICYNNPADREYGPRCAANAIQQEKDKVYEGQPIYVREALNKEQREQEKRREQLRFKNSKKRCNLYVKNFPPNTTEAELRTYFEKYGEIESIKLLPKEGEALYAFVCYKSPDHAALAKQQLHMQTFNGKTLYINHYELKEVRKIQQEEARDKADFQNLKRSNPTNLSLDVLNRPEIFQIIQLLMTQMRQNFNRPQMGYNNRQGGQRGPNPRYNQQPGGMPQRPMNQPQPGMGMPQPQMRPPVQQIPAPMPIGQTPMMGMPSQQTNLPPHIVAYNMEGQRLLPAVVPQNPNYKQQVGEFIYEYVEQAVGEDVAPKITGMLIDLSQQEIQQYLVDFNKLQFKIGEAVNLLKQQQK